MTQNPYFGASIKTRSALSYVAGVCLTALPSMLLEFFFPFRWRPLSIGWLVRQFRFSHGSRQIGPWTVGQFAKSPFAYHRFLAIWAPDTTVLHSSLSHIIFIFFQKQHFILWQPPYHQLQRLHEEFEAGSKNTRCTLSQTNLQNVGLAKIQETGRSTDMTTWGKMWRKVQKNKI